MLTEVTPMPKRNPPRAPAAITRAADVEHVLAHGATLLGRGHRGEVSSGSWPRSSDEPAPASGAGRATRPARAGRAAETRRDTPKARPWAHPARAGEAPGGRPPWHFSAARYS